MPYIGNYSQDEEDKKRQDSSGNEQLASPSATTSTTSVGAGPSAKAPTSSGSYTNLQKYLTANADQSPSSAIVSKIGEEAGQARMGLQSAVSSFADKASHSYTPVDNSLVDKAVSDPVHLSDEEKSRIQAQRKNEYKGPSDLNDVEGFVGTAGANVNEALKATETEPGQYSLLQRFLSRPGYSRGEQGLDQMLLKNTDKGKSDFESARSQYGGVENEYNAAQEAARTQAAAKKTEVDEGAKYASDKISGGISSANKAVEDRLAQYMSQYQEQVAAEQARVAGRGTSWRVDPSQYLNVGASPEMGNVISQDEAARLNALSGLMDQPGQQYMNAGSYDPSKAAVFNSDGFSQAVGESQKAYNTTANPLISELRSLHLDPLNSGLVPVSNSNGGRFQRQDLVQKAIEERVAKLNELRAYYGQGAADPSMYNGTITPFIGGSGGGMRG